MKVNKHMKQIGEIKDRGIIKWQGLMLPEHVEMIKEWRVEDKKVPKPDLDEYDMQLIHEEIDLAMKRQCLVYIHTWKGGKVTRHHRTVSRVDLKTRILYYEDPFEDYRLNLDEVASITMTN